MNSVVLDAFFAIFQRLCPLWLHYDGGKLKNDHKNEFSVPENPKWNEFRPSGSTLYNLPSFCRLWLRCDGGERKTDPKNEFPVLKRFPIAWYFFNISKYIKTPPKKGSQGHQNWLLVWRPCSNYLLHLDTPTYQISCFYDQMHNSSKFRCLLPVLKIKN